MNEQFRFWEDNTEYEQFVEKFKPKKTTDDCYTPVEVYNAIADWACNRYQLNPGSLVRPFFPGGDYERFHYPQGCVVLDNPPFSILSQIVDFYLSKNICFFLFAPSLTCFSSKNCMNINHIVSDSDITYENGAKVRTAFVTNLDSGIVAESAPDLGVAIETAQKKIKDKKALPKYDYPPCVLTSAMLQKLAGNGVEFKVHRKECEEIAKLDSQKKLKKTIFGGGLLLSQAATERKKRAEERAKERAKECKIIWELSEREKEIIKNLE